MKYSFCLCLVFLVLVSSCDFSSKKVKDSRVGVSKPHEQGGDLEALPVFLIKKFTQIEFPFEINFKKKKSDSNNLKQIDLEIGQKYFGTKYSEESEMPNQLLWRVGCFPIPHGKQGLIIRSLQVPVGSGEHIDFLLYVLDEKGKILDIKSIAHSYGWDGGYDEQECIIADNEISFTFLKEVSGYGIDYEMQGRGFYMINETSGKITQQDIKVESYKNLVQDNEQAFDAKSINNGDIPDIIRKDLSGKFERGTTWHDGMGENYLIFTMKSFPSKEQDSEDEMDYEMYGYHYVFEGKTKFPKRLWKTTDFIRNCAFDSVLGLKEDLIEIRDFNGNNVAETIYTYTNGCVSDVSPYDVKLILHEGKEKLALRGLTRFTHDASLFYEPEFKIDTSKFNNIPKQFIWQSEERFKRNSLIHF